MFKTIMLTFLVIGLSACKEVQTQNLVYPGDALFPSLASERVLKELNADPGARNLWRVAKTYTSRDSYSVFQGPDNNYYAIDTYSFHGSRGFAQQLSSGVVVKVDKVYTYSDFFKDPITGIVFEAGDYSEKDLESVAAFLNDEEIASMRIGLMSEFGLSETRATELSAMASSLSSVLKNQNRALTERDFNSLQIKAIGFTVADLAKAKVNGDSKALNDFAKSAASLNKISVEQAKRLITQMSN